MKKIYILILFIISFGKGFSQDCISLGCTSNYGIQTADGTLPSLTGALLGGGCFGGPNTFKQVFWQFFYSPIGGDFTQAYTPVIDGGTQLDLDYIVYDMGVTAPISIPCPMDPTVWSMTICNNFGGFDVPTGPGAAGGGGNVLTTTAGHYYAIAVILWQGPSNGGDASYSFTIGIPQLGGLDLTAANCPGVLPVKLSSFGATVNNCMTTLEWTTESQPDFKNYDVQYSTNGTAFQTVANIAGSVQASRQKYTYQDNNLKQGNIYYRLKMTNFDGRYVYSKIIALKLNCSQNSLFIYPNPVTNILNVNITNIEKDVTIATLFDTNGRLIYSREMVNGTNLINMEKFAKGVYLLKLKNSVETQNRKIIK